MLRNIKVYYVAFYIELYLFFKDIFAFYKFILSFVTRNVSAWYIEGIYKVYNTGWYVKGV